jgi:phosphohistidine phosphatase
MKSDTNKIIWEEELYEASVRTFLEVINELQVEWKNVIMVGHNPTISYLAEYITGSDIGDLSTCSVVQIDFSLKSWAEVSEGNGDFIRIIEPDQIGSSQ